MSARKRSSLVQFQSTKFISFSQERFERIPLDRIIPDDASKILCLGMLAIILGTQFRELVEVGAVKAGNCQKKKEK